MRSAKGRWPEHATKLLGPPNVIIEMEADGFRFGTPCQFLAYELILS